MKNEKEDYINWLHEIRKKMREEEKKSGLSGSRWIKKISEEAEKIIGQKIQKIEIIKR